MKRVTAYIDGFNLYFGLKAARLKRLYWLDLPLLIRQVLRPDQQLTVTHYFTARIRDNGRNAEDRRRQATYLDALAAGDTRCQFGHYLAKRSACRHCGAAWLGYEEKMTDVNIAVQLISDAYDDIFDVAMIISGDSDLSSPIRHVRRRFPGKRLIVAFPPRRQSGELKRCANGYLSIGEDKLRKSQLPDVLTQADGVLIHRPSTWT